MKKFTLLATVLLLSTGAVFTQYEGPVFAKKSEAIEYIDDCFKRLDQVKKEVVQDCKTWENTAVYEAFSMGLVTDEECKKLADYQALIKCRNGCEYLKRESARISAVLDSLTFFRHD